MPRLLDAAGGGALLDLGCGDGLAARLAAQAPDALRRTRPRAVASPRLPSRRPRPARRARAGGPAAVRPVPGRLRPGLAPAARASCGGCCARHRCATPARVRSWPSRRSGATRWSGRGSGAPPVGPARTLPYRLGADVAVHPWSPPSCSRASRARASQPLRALDRSLQAGPKVGEGRYWPGLPPLRGALTACCAGRPPRTRWRGRCRRCRPARPPWCTSAGRPPPRAGGAPRPARRRPRRGDLGARAGRARAASGTACWPSAACPDGVRRRRSAECLAASVAAKRFRDGRATARASAIVSTSRSGCSERDCAGPAAPSRARWRGAGRGRWTSARPRRRPGPGDCRPIAQ